MYPWYTYMADQQPQPQADLYLVGQPAVPQMATPVLPPPPVHQVGTHPAVHGQHYVYVSTAPPQSVPVPYTQAGQTPIKLETSTTPPMPTTPQMTPKTPKNDKTNSVQWLPVQVAVSQQLQVQNQNFMASVPQFSSQEEVVDSRLLKFGNTM